MDAITQNIISSVGSAILIGGGALLIEPVRSFFRYRTYEYELMHRSNDAACTWDVQWEGLRLTIDAQEVHNDHLAGVLLKLNDASPGHEIQKWQVANTYIAPDRWPIQVKLSAIIRKKTGNERIYNVHCVIRRKRWH